MKNLLTSHHPRRHISSFKYAFQGLFHVFMNEANFRVQVVYLVTTMFLAWFFRASLLEWLLLIITGGGLLAAEIINTLVEEFIDHLIKEHHEGVRVIKDLAASYVLMVSFVAIVTFLFVFVPKLLAIYAYYY